MIDRGTTFMRTRARFSMAHGQLRMARRAFRKLRDDANPGGNGKAMLRKVAEELGRADVALNDARRLLGLPALR